MALIKSFLLAFSPVHQHEQNGNYRSIDFLKKMEIQIKNLEKKVNELAKLERECRRQRERLSERIDLFETKLNKLTNTNGLI
jgi:septal ring factor EnvC (AmiA/AmiB activator)